MKLESTNAKVTEVQSDAVVIGIYEDGGLDAYASALDSASGGVLRRLVDSGEISTSRCSVTLLPEFAGIQSRLVAVVGLGPVPRAVAFREGFRGPALPYQAAAAAAKKLAGLARGEISYFLDFEAAEDAVCGSLVGCLGQDIFRAERKMFAPEKIAWGTASPEQMERGQILAEAIGLTRQWVNLPANFMYPEEFASKCEELGRQQGLGVEVWDEEQLHSEKCRALLAVAQGSSRPARLVILRHWNGTPGPAAFGACRQGCDV